MTYTEAIKNGFRLANHRLQLIAIQAGLMVINCFFFFVVVGIPLGIAFVIFGLDLTNLLHTKNILDVFTSPAGIIEKYFGLVLMVLASFLLYSLLNITLKLYVFGGSAGMLGLSVIEPSGHFSMKAFFHEAKQLFFPLTWYFSLIGLICIPIAIVMILGGVALAAIVAAARSQDQTLALFLGIFFSIAFTLIAVIVILSMLTLTIYGIAALLFKREGAIKALKNARRYLWEKQHVFWFSMLLLFGYIVVSFMLIAISYPFFLIPVFGLVISLPVELVLYYLWLVVLAVVFKYYYESEIRPAATPDAGPADPSSTQDAGTSLPPNEVQTPVPPESEELKED